MTTTKNPSTAMDMTYGSIPKLLLTFAVPLLLGNIFQMLYNTVDVLVVGNFVGKEALAAVGSTSSIINVAVFFFNGLSVGAGVVISRFYGAHDQKMLHTSIETTIAMTLACCIFFTVAGVPLVPQMLRLMSTPDDVMAAATQYLRIYFGGISGLMLYNMGSGILRAVGDSRRPLYFLIFSSILNIVLDLFFVGVGYATVLSQFISAALIFYLLLTTKDVYKFSFRDMTLDLTILGQIFAIGLPAAVQSMFTAFSNVFVQGYINSFGSSSMAGWSCYGKLQQFVFLSVHSVANAATTFVSQNIGAEQEDRADSGTGIALWISGVITAITALLLFIFAAPATFLFTPDQEVVSYGALFMRTNILFMVFNSVNHVLAGSLRGRGDSKGPMVIMLVSFVLLRQLYLYVGSLLTDSIYIVCFAFPVGWVACCLLETGYYLLYYRRKAS